MLIYLFNAYLFIYLMLIYLFNANLLKYIITL